MTEHPLLFTGDMVRAIMDGRKTQTRRINPHKFRNWQVGDLIWPRETWRKGWISKNKQESGIVIYQADIQPFEHYMFKWKPSIHMPKDLARNWLRITGLREENVQDISDNDASAEGVVLSPSTLFPTMNTTSKQREQFPRLWDSVNKKRGHGWDKNPKVIAIEFERTDQ